MSGSLALVNQRTDAAVADRVEVAVTRKTRRKGLLGRPGLEASDALVLAPCAAVHTMFMRFAIDVVFVDADGRALRIVPRLGPWRIAVEPFAHAVVEMAAGSMATHQVRIGDRLYLRKEDGGRVLLHASDMRSVVPASVVPASVVSASVVSAFRRTSSVVSAFRRTPSDAGNRAC